MYNAVVKLVKIFVCLFFKIEVNGVENVPKEGGFILCCNHISCWDPVVLQIFFPRRIYFMAKAELFRVFFVGWILKLIKAIPVKRSGSDITAVKTAIHTVKDGDCLGIFPTGQREKVKGEGEVKSGIGFIAYRSGGNVLPVHIDASYRIFSKVTVNIGKSANYWHISEKPSSHDLEEISKQIYSDIKCLGGNN